MKLSAVILTLACALMSLGWTRSSPHPKEDHCIFGRVCDCEWVSYRLDDGSLSTYLHCEPVQSLREIKKQEALRLSPGTNTPEIPIETIGATSRHTQESPGAYQETIGPP
ncbi:MAG: hypothetical protein ACT4OO_10565 [Nitrospiraceae bacterium]